MRHLANEAAGERRPPLPGARRRDRTPKRCQPRPIQCRVAEGRWQVAGILSASEFRTTVRARVVLLASSLLVCAADIAHGADWRMDLAESKLEYIATFQKARASGTFKEFDTRVRFDEHRLADSRIDATVAVASADMIDVDANNAIRGPDWFDSARFPRAGFHASDVRQVGEHRRRAGRTCTFRSVGWSSMNPRCAQRLASTRNLPKPTSPGRAGTC
jgi:hypothetical protein